MKGKVQIIKYGDPVKLSQEATEQAILQLGLDTAAQAKDFAPVDKGTLRGSIMVRTFGKDSLHEDGPMIDVAPKKGEGYVGTAVEYGIYHEFGTRKMKPHPFLRPAIAVTQGKNWKEMVAAIQRYWMKNIKSPKL